MVKIFQNNKEPLFGRADRILYLKPLAPKTIRDLLLDEGHYWERGNKNEIDLVGINDLDKKVMVAEVKLNAKRVCWQSLKEKAVKLEQLHSEYVFEYKGFGLGDIEQFF